MTDPFELVLDRLAEHGCGPKERGGTITSRCPAHDDTNPSLTVNRGTKGRDVVLHCHTGCTADAVLEALELTWTDFTTTNGNGTNRAEIIATYDYHDAYGTLLFQAVRYYPKAFRQRRPDGTGGWTWKLGDTPRVLYHLPEVLAEAALGGEIWIAEGEKDVDALRAAGVVATCNPMGAGKFTIDHAHTLRGITRAIIVADRDQPGRDHAVAVAQHLSFAGIATIHIVEAAAGKDAADHLAAGHGVDDFEVVDPAVDWSTPAPETGDDQDNTWDPVNLTAALAAPRVTPTLLARQDGRHLLYSGRINMLYGESGQGKSWVALHAVAEQLQAGHTAIYIDLEDDAAPIVLRLTLLGVPRTVVLERFIYLHPEQGAREQELARLDTIIAERNPTILVVDSVGEAMTLQNVKQNDDDAVSTWYRAFARRWARQDLCVILIDHVPKDPARPRGWSIGSQRKKAALTGTMLAVEPITAFAVGHPGRLKLTCSKDRNGAWAMGEIVAEVTIDGDGDKVDMTVLEPAGRNEAGQLERPTYYMEKVSLYVERPQLTTQQRFKNNVRDAVGTKKAVILQAINVLESEGFITVRHEKVDRVWGDACYCKRPYRQNDDVIGPTARCSDAVPTVFPEQRERGV